MAASISTQKTCRWDDTGNVDERRDVIMCRLNTVLRNGQPGQLHLQDGSERLAPNLFVRSLRQ